VIQGQHSGWKKEALLTRKEVTSSRATRPGFP
jgi:hypothetical protein